MALGYYDGDFARTNSAYTSVTGNRNGTTYTKNAYMLTSSHALYNGNISAWASQTQAVSGSGTQYEQLTGNSYRYDILNRLRADAFSTFSSNAWTASEDYGSSYTYDANGNIKTLTRTKASATVFDNLTYVYYEGE
ncbi:MAG: hypothetical protein JNL32_11695, partial [Candidatus Kapabacteria bacterium]|nr:hypothetical protein [Candidatus Kapabacteria bacterium]